MELLALEDKTVQKVTQKIEINRRDLTFGLIIEVKYAFDK